MPTQVLTAEQKQFIVASNMEGVTDGEVVDSYLELKSNQYAMAPLGVPQNGTRGNGTSLYGTIPTWTATNWEIEFDVVFPTAASNDRKLIEGDTGGTNRPDINVSSTGKITWNTAVISSLTLDGVALTSGVTSMPLDGAPRHIKASGSVAINVGTLLCRYSRDSKYANSVIFNLVLRDLGTPANTRTYPMDSNATSSVMTDTSSNAQHGTWVNRTAGNIETIYPSALKPGKEFWFAFRYKVTDVSQNSGYNYLLSIGSKASGKSGYLIYLPESNGQIGIDQYNNGTRAVAHYGLDFGTTHLDGLTHTAVVHIKTDGSFEYWVDTPTPTYSSGTALPTSAMEFIHLNGYRGAAGASSARMGADINYFFVYDSLDPSDVQYILQGDNPALFGEVRQGYLLNGDTTEILNQTPLTLYPVEDPPKFQDVVRNYIKSWFMNMMGWIT